MNTEMEVLQKAMMDFCIRVLSGDSHPQESAILPHILDLLLKEESGVLFLLAPYELTSESKEKLRTLIREKNGWGLCCFGFRDTSHEHPGKKGQRHWRKPVTPTDP